MSLNIIINKTINYSTLYLELVLLKKSIINIVSKNEVFTVLIHQGVRIYPNFFSGRVR
jgi:hypothetical protein